MPNLAMEWLSSEIMSEKRNRCDRSTAVCPYLYLYELYDTYIYIDIYLSYTDKTALPAHAQFYMVSMSVISNPQV